jgi:predicted amidohydrolase
MKGSRSKLFVVVIFLLVASACAPAAPPTPMSVLPTTVPPTMALPSPTPIPPAATAVPPPPASAPSSDLQKLVMSYADAFNKRDLDSALALFVDDGLLFMWDSVKSSNKQAVRNWLEYQIGLGGRYTIADCSPKGTALGCTLEWRNEYCVKAWSGLDVWRHDLTLGAQDSKIRLFSVMRTAEVENALGSYRKLIDWAEANRPEQWKKVNAPVAYDLKGRPLGELESQVCKDFLAQAQASPATATTAAARPPNSVPLIVASVSMNAQTDKAANLKKFERYMTDAAAQGAHLVVFPEVALQQNPGWGFLNDQPTPQEITYVNDTAEPIPGESTAWLTAKAKQLGIYVIFGMTERGEDGKLYNTSVFLGPEGVLARYRKSYLWDADDNGNEHLFWTPGTDKGMVVDSPLGKIGLMICIEMSKYYLEFGEKGADLIVTVSAWPAEGGPYYGYYGGIARTPALNCHCWHVVADQVGTVGHTVDYGHSRIIDPEGTVIADTGADEGMVIAKTGLFINSTFR